MSGNICDLVKEIGWTCEKHRDPLVDGCWILYPPGRHVKFSLTYSHSSHEYYLWGRDHFQFSIGVDYFPLRYDTIDEVAKKIRHFDTLVYKESERQRRRSKNPRIRIVQNFFAAIGMWSVRHLLFLSLFAIWIASAVCTHSEKSLVTAIITTSVWIWMTRYYKSEFGFPNLPTALANRIPLLFKFIKREVNEAVSKQVKKAEVEIQQELEFETREGAVSISTERIASGAISLTKNKIDAEEACYEECARFEIR